jgi:hypothetical protein
VPQAPSGIIAELLQRTRAKTVQPVLPVYTVAAATSSDVQARTSVQPDLSEATVVPETEPDLIVGDGKHIKILNDYNTIPVDKDDQMATDLPNGHEQLVTVAGAQHEPIEHSTNTDPGLEHEHVECDTNPVTDDNHLSSTLQFDREEAIAVPDISNDLSEHNINAVQETEHNLKDYNTSPIGKSYAGTQTESTPYVSLIISQGSLVKSTVNDVINIDAAADEETMTVGVDDDDNDDLREPEADSLDRASSSSFDESTKEGHYLTSKNSASIKTEIQISQAVVGGTQTDENSFEEEEKKDSS